MLLKTKSILSVCLLSLIFINHSSPAHSQVNQYPRNNSNIIGSIQKPSSIKPDPRIAEAQERLQKTRQTLAQINNLIYRNPDSNGLLDARDRLMAKERKILQEIAALNRNEIEDKEIYEQEKLEEYRIREELGLNHNRTLKEAYDSRLELIRNSVKELKENNLRRIKETLFNIENSRLENIKAINRELEERQRAADNSPEALYDNDELRAELIKLKRFSLATIEQEIIAIEERIEKIEEERLARHLSLKDKSNNSVLIDNLGLKNLEKKVEDVKEDVYMIEQKIETKQ
ncbi:MAG: hypothetical protein O3B09_00210 [Proteobacteria bacterium]|nr:hypothetical protein [Pseudomonadota bacterium]